VDAHEDHKLKPVQSMFSLKKNKTMRVKKWGTWIAYVDEETHKTYWYSQSLNTGQWEMPPEVMAMQANDQTKTLHAKASKAALLLPNGGKNSMEEEFKVRYMIIVVNLTIIRR
jgi:hypothetical protein